MTQTSDTWPQWFLAVADASAIGPQGNEVPHDENSVGEQSPIDALQCAGGPHNAGDDRPLVTCSACDGVYCYQCHCIHFLVGECPSFATKTDPLIERMSPLDQPSVDAFFAEFQQEHEDRRAIIAILQADSVGQSLLADAEVVFRSPDER